MKDLADKLDVRGKDVLGKLRMKRLMMTINSPLDTEIATMLAREVGERLSGGFERQAGFADPARAAQGQQPHVGAI